MTSKNTVMPLHSSPITHPSVTLPMPRLHWQRVGEVPGLDTSPVYNPSRGQVIAEARMCGADIVDEAVEAAADAFPAWRETPPIERARVLFRFRGLLEEHFERSARASRASTARRSSSRAAT